MFYFDFLIVLLPLLASFLFLLIRFCLLCISIIFFFSEFHVGINSPQKAVFQPFRFLLSPVRYLFQLTGFFVFLLRIFFVSLIVHSSASYLEIQLLYPPTMKNETKLECEKSNCFNIKLKRTKTTVPFCAAPPWSGN